MSPVAPIPARDALLIGPRALGVATRFLGDALPKVPSVVNPVPIGLEVETSLPPTPWRDFVKAGPQLLGAILQLNGLEAVDAIGEAVGPMFTTPPLPHIGRAVLVSDPKLVKQLYVAKSDVIDFEQGVRLTEIAYGSHSLFLQGGKAHTRLRQILMPSFRGDTLERHRATMAAVINRAIDRIPDGESFRALEVMHDATAEIIVRICMGINDPDQLQEWLPVIHDFVATPLSTEGMMRVLLSPVLGFNWPAFERVRDRADALLYAEITRRRDTPGLEDADDVLAALLRGRTEDGEALTDVEIRDQLVTLLLAGHETTATTAAWALERITRHPNVLARLTAEARDGSGEQYARAVANETLRLRPSVPGIVRVASAPFPLGDHLLPAGTWVAVLNRGLVRNAELFPDPDTFNPDRFLDRPPPQFGMVIFGWGPHRCLGMHFAMLELCVVMHALLRRADLHAPDPRDEPVMIVGGALAPKHGATVIIRHRREAATPKHRAGVTSTPASAGAPAPQIRLAPDGQG